MNLSPRNAEDYQPNENLRKRKGSNLPPVIRVTAPPKPQNTTRGGHHPYRGHGRGRGGGFRGGHGPSSSHRGGRGRPPGFLHPLPARPPIISQERPQQEASTDQLSAPHGTNIDNRHPAPAKNEARQELESGPVAGPSNAAPSPQPKVKRQERKLWRAKRNKNKDKNVNQKHPSKRVETMPAGGTVPSRPSNAPGYHPEQSNDSCPTSSASIPTASGSNTRLLQTVSSDFSNLDVHRKGTLRISPLPVDCEAGHPLMVVNRSIWTAMKRTELVRKGLSVTKSSIMYVSYISLFFI